MYKTNPSLAQGIRGKSYCFAGAVASYSHIFKHIFVKPINEFEFEFEYSRENYEDFIRSGHLHNEYFGNKSQIFKIFRYFNQIEI